MWVKIDLKYFKINDALQVYSHLSRWCKRRKKKLDAKIQICYKNKALKVFGLISEI